MSPKQIGRYEILEEIGRGGMGIVYKARDPLLQRTVAIKVLPPEMKVDQQFVARFMQEARHAAQLEHPHIVSIYDVGEEKGTYYFAMQFVDGVSLAEAVRAHPRWSLPQTARVIEQVAAALDYAHQRGVVHRDIKPDNILIDRAGNVKVTDFGIARAVEGTQLTRTGALLGTPEYMSPEQAEGRPVDGRSDIYSLGVVLYEMLTGSVPFRADTPLATALKHIKDPPPPPRRLNPDLPGEVESIVLKALEKKPERRYQTPTDLTQALQKAVTLPSTAVVSRPRQWTLQAAGVLGLLALVLIGYAFYNRHQKYVKLLECLQQGMASVNQARWDDAIETLSGCQRAGADSLLDKEKLFELHLNLGNAHFGQGMAYRERGAAAQAQAAFAEAIPLFRKALHHRDDLVVAVKKRVYDPLGLRWKEQDDRAALAKIPDPACGLVTARTRIPHRVLRESRDTGRGVSDILGERKHR